MTIKEEPPTANDLLVYIKHYISNHLYDANNYLESYLNLTNDKTLGLKLRKRINKMQEWLHSSIGLED